jgi:hypothetical protein
MRVDGHGTEVETSQRKREKSFTEAKSLIN